MVKIRKLPPNQGTKGRGTLGTHPTTVAKGLETTKGRRRPRKVVEKRRLRKNVAKVIEASPQMFLDMKNVLTDEVEQKVLEQALRGEHVLSFSPFERFQMRQMAEADCSQVEIAQRFNTSLAVVGKVLRMKEKLSKAREEELARHFFAFSKLLDDVLAGMSVDKISRASFSQLSLAMGIGFDKMLAARKALDGDAPDKHQHEILVGNYAERQDLLQSVREKLVHLREESLLPVESTVVSEVRPTLSGVEGKSASETQLELFTQKEPE